jgi:hypothetical protein
MQMSKAAELQKEWAAKGSPPCDHPRLESEFYLGTRTGDKICATCGEDFSPHQLRQMGRS